MPKNILRFSVVIALFIATISSLQAGGVPAYFNASYTDAKTLKGKLSEAGFQVLATYAPAKRGHLKVIIVTNSSLKGAAGKKNRGFAAVEKVLVDSKAKTVLVTNPSYWLKAFLQKNYSAGTAKSVTASFEKALGKLTPGKDTVSSGDLSHYHFMMAMPYYEDMIELKEGTKSVKNKIFQINLANGSSLVGISMPKSVENFIGKIGEDKALVLPYTILLQGGKAYILHPKYYLAISYPKLTMGQFMKISNVPDEIEAAAKKSVK